MATNEDVEAFWAKAEENLAGAVSEYEHRRFDTCAKLAYYACYHAAVAVLLQEGVPPPRDGGIWGYDFVQAQFTRRFIRQRKQYPASLSAVLSRGSDLRQMADYRAKHVTETPALRALQRATEFMRELRQQGG